MCEITVGCCYCCRKRNDIIFSKKFCLDFECVTLYQLLYNTYCEKCFECEKYCVERSSLLFPFADIIMIRRTISNRKHDLNKLKGIYTRVTHMSELLYLLGEDEE